MLPYLLLVPLILILYFLYQFIIKIYLFVWKFKAMDKNTKVFTVPFSGMLGIQNQNIKKYGDSQRFMKDMIKQNPDTKAYLTNIGSLPFIVLCDAQLIKQLSLNPKKFRKFNLYKHSNKSYNKGIFLVQDQDWTAQRGIIKHSFGHQQLKNMIPYMQKSIQKYSNGLKQQIQKSTSKSIDFQVVHDTQTLIGQILVRIFFSQQAIDKKVGNLPFSIALAEYTTTMFYRSRSPLNLIFYQFFGEKVAEMNFTKKDKQLQNYLIQIRKIIIQIVQNRMKINNSEQKDFIQHYIDQMRRIDVEIEQAEKKGQKHKLRRITVQQIIQQLISFYFAGIDTTGHLVAFALYALGQYPQHKARIIQQIKTKLGNCDGITYQNLSKLQFMGNFLDQCLRMWPPATGILSRVVREDVKIGPYNIPGGTLIGTNIIGLMHNPKYYDNPQEFNPQRWTSKKAQSLQAYSFIPFSAGSRSCIGKYLALMETKLILIKFLNDFQLTRTKVPLRLQAKFLYEPIQQDLIKLKIGGMQLK